MTQTTMPAAAAQPEASRPDANRPEGARGSGRLGPELLCRGFLLAAAFSVCYQRLAVYGVQLLRDPASWTDIVRGTADAPDQYRIGTTYAAFFVARVLHCRVSVALGLLDLLGASAGLLLLYEVLQRTAVYRQARADVQWLGSASFAAVAVFYLDWSNWYLKIHTLPTIGLVAGMLWMWTPRGEVAVGLRRWLLVAGLLLLAGAQALVRADAALLSFAGVFAAAVLNLGKGFSLPRWWAVLTSGAALGLIGAIQLYLTRVAYPHASYNGVPKFMLLHDWKQPLLWAVFLVFLSPFLWGVREAARRRFTGDSAGVGFLLGALGYVGLWMCLGRLDEVRIFVPLALATTPLIAELVMLRVQERRHTELNRGMEPE